jgi:hypothetical protein
MTEEQHGDDVTEEAIEDLEAPAVAQGGGAGGTPCKPSAGCKPSCLRPSCNFSEGTCTDDTKGIVTF